MAITKQFSDETYKLLQDSLLHQRQRLAFLFLDIVRENPENLNIPMLASVYAALEETWTISLAHDGCEDGLVILPKANAMSDIFLAESVNKENLAYDALLAFGIKKPPQEWKGISWSVADYWNEYLTSMASEGFKTPGTTFEALLFFLKEQVYAAIGPRKGMQIFDTNYKYFGHGPSDE